MSAGRRPKRVAIVGPPGFWRVAFREVQRRGDRVVRLLLPSAGPDGAARLDDVLADLRSGRIDELLLDLVGQG